MPEEPDWGHAAPWEGRLEQLVDRQWIAHSVADLDALVAPLLEALRNVLPVMKRYLQEEELVGFLQSAFESQEERQKTIASARDAASFEFAPTDVRRDIFLCVLLSEKRDARFDAALARLEEAGNRPHPSARFARRTVERLKRL